MEIDCNNTDSLEYIFDHLDIDEDGKITLHEFVQGTLQLRGMARAKRVFEMHCDLVRESNIMHKQVNSIKRIQRMQTVALDEIYKLMSGKPGPTSQIRTMNSTPEITPPEVTSPPIVENSSTPKQTSTSWAVGSTVKLVGMPEGSQLNGKVGSIMRDLSTESRSEFLVELDKGHPAILVEKAHLEITDNTAPSTSDPQVAVDVKEVKDSGVLQVVPVVTSSPSTDHVLLTAVARQSATLQDLDSKVQSLSDTVMSVARNNAQFSPQNQAATQIIYSQPPPLQGPSAGDSALVALESRMTMRTTALEQEIRALHESVLRCLPPAREQHRAPDVGNSQVYSTYSWNAAHAGGTSKDLQVLS